MVSRFRPREELVLGMLWWVLDDPTYSTMISFHTCANFTESVDDTGDGSADGTLEYVSFFI